jgi:hypothetical protein
MLRLDGKPVPFDESDVPTKIVYIYDAFPLGNTININVNVSPRCYNEGRTRSVLFKQSRLWIS